VEPVQEIAKRDVESGTNRVETPQTDQRPFTSIAPDGTELAYVILQLRAARVEIIR
jgi:hypothetical protein